MPSRPAHASWSLATGPLLGPAAVLALAALAAGCPGHEGSVREPGFQTQARVSSFSESSAVRLLAAAPPYVFAAPERDLVRWDPRTGEALTLDGEHGLPGERVEAMAYDKSSGVLWVATDRGVSLYNVEHNTFRSLGDGRVESFAGVAVAPADDGGVWLGYQGGLVHVDAAGTWQESEISQPVSALLVGRDGALWIGTSAGAMSRAPSGEMTRFGPEQGCDVSKVRFIAETPDGTPVIVGENKAGEQRIALVLSDACATYRASPNIRWLAAAHGPEELVVLTPERLYGVRSSMVGARSLSREGMRLLPVSIPPDSPPRKSPYGIRSLATGSPASPHSIEVIGEHVLVGTSVLGIASLPIIERRGEAGWLRRGELVQGAQTMTVACAAEDDCFVATGGPRAWRYGDAGFAPESVQGLQVLAFVQAQSGEIYALTRDAEQTRIVVHRRVDSGWSQITGLEIEVPGHKPQVRCARFGPDGLLWLGLAHEDEAGNVHSHGMAAVEMSLAAVTYHRGGGAEKDEGVLPIPLGVMDVAFQDETVWLATSEGVVRARGREAIVFSEASGLMSELVYGIAASPRGPVYIATAKGVGVYEGGQWLFPADLRWPVNDVEMGQDGRLWMATERGVVVYDGARVRRIDQHRGLLQNEIAEIRADRFGRIWARSSHGLTLITP
jgi:hypothetical protein